MVQVPVHLEGSVKAAKVKAELQPLQRNVVEALRRSPGLVAAYGTGTGKTLASIAAAHELGMPIEAIVPAALQENYAKEIAKHVEGEQPARIRSYEKATKDQTIDPNALMVLDEAHRIRNAMSSRSATLQGLAPHAQKRLALTGSPIYNRPADIASLVNFAAGKEVLPSNPKQFKKMFIGERKLMPSLYAQLRGVQPGVEEYVKGDPYLYEQLKKYVLYKKDQGNEHFPKQDDEVVNVPMSKVQNRVYRGLLRRLPFWAQYKFKRGLPPSKREARELNAFMGGVRQVSNTPSGFLRKLTPEKEREHTPKINKAVETIRKNLKKNPRHRAVIFTNYLQSGVDPIERRLREAGIPHAVFKGGLKPEERKQIVHDYNTGKTPVLAITSSGAEGLDLKGTRAVHLIEPHFNDEKIQQVIGRARRYKSHEHLPEDERKVKVLHYAAQPRAGLLKRLFTKQKHVPGVDEYLMGLSHRKAQLGKQLERMMQIATKERLRAPHMAA